MKSNGRKPALMILGTASHVGKSVITAGLGRLFADAGYTSVVGTHSFGPVWESVSGSKVAGAVLQKCVVDPNSVAWLLLAATPIEGAGVFQKVAFIQRINTAGGNAPSYSGSLGEEARIPYTTEYLFYKAP